MVALGLQWVPMRRRSAAEAGGAGHPQRAQALLAASWLGGAAGNARVAQRRSSQMRMIGLSAEGG
eukprot:5094262-Pleurochrysis_carterae.AAC.1